VQFNQAQPSGEIECSGVQFGEEEFIETALAADCIDRARARGIDNRCVDEVSCSLSGAPAGTSAPANAAWWLAGLALALLGRRRR
jgi:MYXO-CTERM domain-containing protein